MPEHLTFLFGDKIFLGAMVLTSAIIIYFRSPKRLLDYIIGLFIVIALSEITKYFVDKPRPESYFIFEGGGFPSTHTSIAFYAAFFYLIACHSLSGKSTGGGEKIAHKWGIGEAAIVFVLFLLASIIAYFRVILAAHDMLDVFAGIMLGFFTSFIFFFYDIRGGRVR